MTENWSEVLYKLSLIDVSIMPGGEVTLSSTLAEVCNMTKKDVLKELRRLKALHYVTTGYNNYYDENLERWCITTGWHTTRKAKTTAEYRKAYERERELCRKIWNIDIGELITDDEGAAKTIPKD